MKNLDISKLLKIGLKKFSEDYYKTLGLTRSATKLEIKKSFIKLAKEFHPDKNPNASKEKFKKITEAYQTLTDIKKRDLYDKKGMTKEDQQMYNNKNNNYDDFQNFWKSHNNENFEDIYSDFSDFFKFTNSSKPKKLQKGEDIKLEITLTFLESTKPTKKKITYTTLQTCLKCKGSKCNPGTILTKCPICRGKGSKIKRQGPMQFNISCEECEGFGKVNKSPCRDCRGKGEVLGVEREQVDVPAGVESNQVLRVRGRGNRGVNGGERGDLFLKIVVERDACFWREGLDVFCDCWISLRESVLGGVVRVRVLDGVEEIRVREGCSFGDCVRIEGRGVRGSEGVGDFWVVFKVRLPEELTSEEIKLFEELRSLDAIRKEKIMSKEKNEKKDFYQNSYEKETETAN